MAVNFPSNPTNGQTITASGITYAYDSTQGVWSDSPQGLTQAIDALTDVDTSTSAPSNGQTLQWNSTDSEWQPADSSAGVTVYATIDDLPLTGIAEGSMALVDSTDKLYIFSDSGWYSISIVNTTPSISGVNANYTLATDGTATTITVSATDPEGLPLTYSIVSDTSGNVATVAQGTGSNTNQWTITPTTNTANGGNFTLVFRASDGVNIASASSTFSLVFVLVIPNSQYTSALFTSVGANNAVNNSFSDASTNNHTITAIWNVTQNTFSPYRDGGYSNFYSETVAESHTSTLSAMGSSTWTIEAWFYRTGGSGSGIDVALHVGAINSTTGFGIGLQSSAITFRAAGTGDSTFNIANTTNRWIHFAFVYDGTDLECFANGSSLGSVTRSLNITDTSINIGYNYTTFSYGGYIKDVRASSVARYSSTFDVPTESFTSDTDTLFLLNNATLTDDSSNAGTISSSGSPSISAFSPYDREEYDAANHGGSIYFDGSGDRLTVGSDNSFLVGTGSVTMECWCYPTAAGQDATGDVLMLIWSGSNNSVWLSYTSTKKFDFRIGYSGGSTAMILDTTNSYELNQWHHVAVVRDSNDNSAKIYVNGVNDGSSTNSTDLSTYGSSVEIGAQGTGRTFQGNITDARIVKDAVYTANFTPPTAPLTAITNTSLLINGTNAGIIDKSQSVKTITLNGDVKSSTTQTKFLSSSMKFDGNGDYIAFTSDLYGWAGDFTIEAWVYHTSFGAYSNPIYTTGANGSLGADFFELGANAGGAYQVFWGGGSPLIIAPAANVVPVNTWSHIAVTRSGSALRLYKNGTLSASTTKTGALPSSTTDRSFIGTQSYGAGATTRSFYGYMSDVRLTKGLARYTSNFTAPTDALEG